MALASGAGRRGSGYEVMVRVDHSALVRGYALDGETCELAGFGPVSPQVVADIMERWRPVPTRPSSPRARTWWAWPTWAGAPTPTSARPWTGSTPACAVEGCGVRSQYCQTDHRADWAQAHVTVFELLDRLCKIHHDLKTYQGWGLVAGKGNEGLRAPRGRPSPPPWRAGGPARAPPTTAGTGPRAQHSRRHAPAQHSRRHAPAQHRRHRPRRQHSRRHAPAQHRAL